LKDPNYSRTEATDFEEVLKAGRFVFSDDAFDADLNEPIAARIRTIQWGHTARTKVTVPWDSEEEEERKDVRREVQTKKVAFTPTVSAPIKSTKDEVEDLARQMHGLDIGDVAYSVCYTHLVYLAPAAAQAWAPPHSRQLVNTATSHSTSSLPYLPLPPL
jgi:hypothetical protein